MNWFIGHGEHVVRAFQVTDRGVQVNRLNRVAGGEVHDVETLCQLKKILKVLTVSRVTRSVEFHEVWRACDRAERHPVTTNVERVVRVARVQLEFARTRFDGLNYKFWVKANTVVGNFRSARFGDQVKCFWK